MVYIKQSPLDRIEALRQQTLRGPFSVILSQPMLNKIPLAPLYSSYARFVGPPRGLMGSRRRRCRAEYRGARRYVGKDLTIAAAESSFSTFLERTIEGFTPNSGHPALTQP